MENYEPSEGMSGECFIAVDPRYPLEHPENISVRVTREGASEPEVEYSPSGWTPTQNYAVNEVVLPVLIKPNTYTVKYAVHSQVLDMNPAFNIARILLEASECARRQCSDNILRCNVEYRYFDNRDSTLRVHFIGEQVDADDIPMPLPININICSSEGCQEFRAIQAACKPKGIDMLIVNDIYSCYTDYVPPNDPPSCSTCSDTPQPGKCGIADGLSQIPIIFRAKSVGPARVFLHELGHNCGLNHIDFPYNVMNVGEQPWGDDINRIVDDQSAKFISYIPFNDSISNP